MHIRYHYIRLTKWSGIRNYTATLQFRNEDLSGDGALTSTTFDGAEGGAYATTGFVQCVSDSGVEDFAGGLWNDPGGGYGAVNSYDTGFIQRKNVTSVTIAITGNSGAYGRFAFFIEPQETPDWKFRMLDWEKSERRTVFVVDPGTGDIHHVHEVFGDKDFIERGIEAGTVEKEALSLATRGQVGQPSAAILAAKSFRYDASKRYRADPQTKTIRVVRQPASRAAR